MLEIIQQKHLHALLHKTKSFQFQPIFIGNYLDSICKLWNADFCFVFLSIKIITNAGAILYIKILMV